MGNGGSLSGIGGMGMMADSSSESLVLADVMSAEVVADEPAETIDNPMSVERIQELIDWTEQLWKSNPEHWETPGYAGYDIIMKSLKEQLDEMPQPGILMAWS